MNILITGGAGYIGSVVAHQLVAQNHTVVIVDNLHKGKVELVPKQATFYEQDIKDTTKVAAILKDHNIDAVMHFAAAKDAGESMVNLTPYSENISNLISVLEAMTQAQTQKIIFSSSAAVYGEPLSELIDESHQTKPINYYGFSKLACEDILNWYSKLKNITTIALRYFNVAGDALNYIDPNAKNIFPIIAEVMDGTREKLTIFGDDYDTPDGTCIRDYIDVRDLARAHILALDETKSNIFNLGSGSGFSVKELVTEFEKQLDIKLPVEIGPRREGDPAKLIAESTLARNKLNWEPKESLHSMVQSTINAYQKKK